jgi:hypothetical protein
VLLGKHDASGATAPERDAIAKRINQGVADLASGNVLLLGKCENRNTLSCVDSIDNEIGNLVLNRIVHKVLRIVRGESGRNGSSIVAVHGYIIPYFVC